MPRRTYVIAFVALAIIFVPLFFDFFFGALVAPCCYAIFALCESFSEPDLLMLFYIVVYLGLFYVAARCTFWVSMLPTSRAAQIVIQSLFLLILFSCSFVRVIEQGPVQYGSSGTYDFWGACVRFLQTH
jgi:hypothetical protein